MSQPTPCRAVEILLVEDDLEDAELTLHALEGGDVSVRTTLVRDGEEALRLLRGEGPWADLPRPDLVLLDMQMPRMDGREVLRAIRGDARLCGLPVCIMTASLVHRTILEREQLRADAFVTKPVSFAQIRDVVRAAVSRFAGL